ncbi:MAG: PCI domain-containing protein [Candidatus Thorarchaeota archaeon]
MNPPSNDEIIQIEADIKNLDLDYMRGWISEEDYNTRIAELKTKLEEAGGDPSALSAASPTIELPKLKPTPEKKAMVDPVTAVKRTIQAMRRLPIERIAQDAGVTAPNVSKIISDLLDGRVLSGRVDHDAGDFILGTGTGPAPKTLHGCPYCRADLNRVAVKGETITCGVCRESFIVS